MILNRIRYFEREHGRNADLCFELFANQLAPEKARQLEVLVERSGILEYESEHRGPADGEHQISVIVESTDGLHETTACDVPLAAEDEELVTFIKTEGIKLANVSKE
jgi:hypothetical protein